MTGREGDGASSSRLFSQAARHGPPLRVELDRGPGARRDPGRSRPSSVRPSFRPIRSGVIMRRLLWGVIVGSAVTLATGRAEAQVIVGGPANPLRMNMMNDYFAAPGNYGMSYGVPSY